MTHGQLAEFPADQIERTFQTNVFSAFWLCQALAPELSKGGSIIVTTSIQAYSPSDHLLDYAATKAALNNLVVNLACELGSQGTRVNAVAPGPIWTPLIPASFDEEKTAKHGESAEMGRPGQPDECAPSYIFLAAESDSSYINGQVLHPNGGTVVNG